MIEWFDRASSGPGVDSHARGYLHSRGGGATLRPFERHEAGPGLILDADRKNKPFLGINFFCNKSEKRIVRSFGLSVIFLIAILFLPALRQGYRAMGLPSCEPEMRGGVTKNNVNISAKPVSSSLISNPTVLFQMNRPSQNNFLPEVAGGVLIFIFSSLIARSPIQNDVQLVAIPATGSADKLGGAIVANMIALGAYTRTNRLPSKIGIPEARCVESLLQCI
ncbi:MAG: 2-oxoacid:acceptor oxidoreductase family protein [Acidobacteria bacterium]|nr:2-oxoacid:acceptor oxidoreductase family protein [Acidobacteriota bacterium]MBI3657957.1 2-oxoacid:acceptor oxidoreductase family protein [Acidobacteriota bacterium]